MPINPCLCAQFYPTARVADQLLGRASFNRGGRTGAIRGGYEPKASRAGDRPCGSGVYIARRAGPFTAHQGNRTQAEHMSDDVWARQEIQSPCIKVCVIHPTERLCTGCLRSLEEIGQWSQMTAEDRNRVMGELPARSGRLKKRRGGRAARVAGA